MSKKRSAADHRAGAGLVVGLHGRAPDFGTMSPVAALPDRQQRLLMHIIAEFDFDNPKESFRAALRESGVTSPEFDAWITPSNPHYSRAFAEMWDGLTDTFVRKYRPLAVAQIMARAAEGDLERQKLVAKMEPSKLEVGGPNGGPITFEHWVQQWEAIDAGDDDESD